MRRIPSPIPSRFMSASGEAVAGAEATRFRVDACKTTARSAVPETMRSVRIRAAASEDVETVRALFLEYAGGLGFSLCFQGFDQELATLPGRYAPPGGRLLLAEDESGALGCVGLRPHAPGECEMKRLYVRPRARGTGAGRGLVARLLEDAREIGYTKMLLDTLP